MTLEDKRLNGAEELASRLEDFDGMKRANVDDYNSQITKISLFATPEEDANLHSLSQLVRNEITSSDMFNIKNIATPNENRREWYDIDITVL